MAEARSEGVWVGVDWGDTEHTVVGVDMTKGKRSSFHVENSVNGLNELIAKLMGLEPVQGVAVESTNALVVAKLLEAGLRVYLINPKLSAAWRQGETVSGAKNDDSDALMLAVNLMRRHKELKVVKPSDDKTRLLVALCADEQTLVGQRTALINQATSLLKIIFPQAVDWLELNTRLAWTFLGKFPNYAIFQKTKTQEITGFFKLNTLRYTHDWEERVKSRALPDPWPVDPVTMPSRVNMLKGLCAQLQALQNTLDTQRSLIDKAFADHPDHDVFSSLPSAGASLAPRLLALFGSDRDNFHSADEVRCITGVAPITFQSGASKTIVFRRACNKRHRNTIHQFAGCSLRSCDWAKAFYNSAKTRGMRHNTILRNLGGKWLEIIFRMWKNRKPYNPHIHLASLVKHGSPIVKAMGPSLATT